MSTKIILASATLVLMASAVQSATFYVDNRLGNDLASGLVAQPQAGDGPVATLAAVMALAGPGDRVVIANTGEPYREMLSVSGPHHSGSQRHPFVIEGNGAVLDGTIATAPQAWEHVERAVFAFQPRRLTYQQLFKDGEPLPRVRLASRHEAATLEPLQWALVDQKMFLCVEDQAAPSMYALRHTHLQTGVTLYNTHHVRIENLVLQGFQQDGINAHELVRNCVLVDVECRANGRSGLSVGGVSEVRVVRGNFYDNGRVQVRTEGLAELELVDGDVEEQGPVPAFSHQGRRLIVNGELIAAP